MNKTNYHFNPASLKLIIGYTGTTHKMRVDRNSLHQVNEWLKQDENSMFLEGCNSLNVRNENGRLIKKL
jgi:hypothetical protein